MAEDWDPFADPADEDHQEPAQAAECQALVASVLDDTSGRSPESSTLCPELCFAAPRKTSPVRVPGIKHPLQHIGVMCDVMRSSYFLRTSLQGGQPVMCKQGRKQSRATFCQKPCLLHVERARPIWRSKGRRKGGGKGPRPALSVRRSMARARVHRRQGRRTCQAKSQRPQILLAPQGSNCLPGHAAWLLGLGSAIQEPTKELPEGATCATHHVCVASCPVHFGGAKEEPETMPTAAWLMLVLEPLEPLSKAREVESAEAESTRAESPRDTDSPAAKTVDQEASYMEGSTSTGDGAEGDSMEGIPAAFGNIQHKELFFKLGEVDEKPSSSSAPSEHGTWGEKGSLARLLRREGLEMPMVRVNDHKLMRPCQYSSLTALAAPGAAVVLADPKMETVFLIVGAVGFAAAFIVKFILPDPKDEPVDIEAAKARPRPEWVIQRDLKEAEEMKKSKEFKERQRGRGMREGIMPR
ncbi:unnamed protein product [Symbiodinium sp. CCMP2592]|nr:unnamed protein product [Symbiodinium sp. CCMP2592]